MNPKSLAEVRRFLGTDAGQDLIVDLQNKRPKITLLGDGIDDSAVIRLASKSAGWEECVEAIKNYIQAPKVEPEMGGFVDFETKKKVK